jgi:uncharacterized cupredoxin-like copper-binding protein
VPYLLDRRTAIAFVVSGLAISGCGQEKDRAATVPPKVVRIAEGDFHVKAPNRLPAGEVELTVENKGPDDHELIVARIGKSELPYREDGLTLDEDGMESSIAGALEPEEPGSHRLKVRLEPGRYLLFCNMSGHFLGGMKKEVEVR